MFYSSKNLCFQIQSKKAGDFEWLLQGSKVNMEWDVSWKEYFRDDERYVDVINGIG